MHVTIDYTPAIQQHAGIGRYADELTRALLVLGEAKVGLFYVDPAGRVPTPPLDTLPRILLRQSNKPWRMRVLLSTYARLSLDQTIGTTDIFHATDHLLPPLHRTRSVFMLHDLTPFKYPTTHAQLNRRFLQLMLPRFLRNATAIVVNSRCTRQDVVTQYAIPAERIRVIYLGVHPRFQPIDPAVSQSARSRYQLPDRFILSVGTIEPRKNLIMLLEAYQVLRERNPDVQLVIAGKRGWHSGPFFERLQTLGLTDQVKLLGFVPDEDLPALYGLAELFAFPSLYEGFGLPVLEAMACGTPVICSNTSSLPEVAGDAAILLPPTEVREWALALQQMMNNVSLCAALRQRGPQQAAQFTWSKTAQQTLAVYRDVCAP